MFIFPKYAAFRRNDYSNLMHGALVSGAEMPAASPLVERSLLLGLSSWVLFLPLLRRLFQGHARWAMRSAPSRQARGGPDGHLWGLGPEDRGR